MNVYVRDCLVADYEHLIPALTLPDPDDRHALAATVRASANVVVRSNLEDFPADTLATCEIEGQHPDHFVADLLQVDPACAAARRHRRSLKRPPESVEEDLAVLGRRGLAKSVSELGASSDLI